MDAKPDGTQYFRITRRSVEIINYINGGRLFGYSELAEEMSQKNIPEFYLRRFKRQMSSSRTRDYIRFVGAIGAFEERGDKFTLKFKPRGTDREWAQALSDLGFVYLTKLLRKSAQELPGFLESKISSFYRIRQLPTLYGLATVLKLAGGREEEYFKWSVSLYVDGETCPFSIRHYPVLAKRPK